MVYSLFKLPADLPALSGRKGSLNPISNLPPLRSGGALGPLKPPLGMDTAYSKVFEKIKVNSIVCVVPYSLLIWPLELAD